MGQPGEGPENQAQLRHPHHLPQLLVPQQPTDLAPKESYKEATRSSKILLLQVTMGKLISEIFYNFVTLET